MSGRGYGKTRLAVEETWWSCYVTPKLRFGVICATRDDVRKTAFEGESGLIACIPPNIIKAYNKQLLEIELVNGSIIQGFSAEEPKRLRGPQFHMAWADELAAWQYPEAWDMLEFCVRLGENTRIIVTTTPKPVPVLTNLLERTDCFITKGSTFENEANLSSKQLQALKHRYEGTRLGQQELYAELLDDIEGALWSHEMLSKLRVKTHPHIEYICIGLDPAVTSTEQSDETGIIVVGIGVDSMVYLLEDLSGKYSVSEWAHVVHNAYSRYQANIVIGEANQGGDLIENNLNMVSHHIRYQAVRATKDKIARANDIIYLYEKSLICHVGNFEMLEHQLCTYTGNKNQLSPDRMDALVWALKHIAPKLHQTSLIPEIHTQTMVNSLYTGSQAAW